MAESLSEGSVSRISFDYGVELLLSDGAVVRVEGDGEVIRDGEVIGVFDAESPVAMSSTLLEFLNLDVVLSLDGAALLVSNLSERLTLTVGPSDDYEAWSLVLPDGSRLVSSCTGEVVRWAGPTE